MMYKQPMEFRLFIAQLQSQLRTEGVVMRPHWGKLHNITHAEVCFVLQFVSDVRITGDCGDDDDDDDDDDGLSTS